MFEANRGRGLEVGMVGCWRKMKQGVVVIAIECGFVETIGEDLGM